MPLSYSYPYPDPVAVSGRGWSWPAVTNSDTRVYLLLPSWTYPKVGKFAYDPTRKLSTSSGYGHGLYLTVFALFNFEVHHTVKPPAPIGDVGGSAV